MNKASQLVNQLMGIKAQTVPVSAANNNWFSITAALGSKPIEIAIYDIIGGYGISAKAFLEEAKAKGVFDAKALNLRMHSPGGSVMDGLAIYNTLARLPATIDIYVDGVVASIATVVTSLPNGRVHIPDNAWMMIHKPWGGTVGNADDLRESADFLDRNETMMLSIYEKKTGKPREEIAAMLTEETWLDGAQAVELGFANVLEAPLQAAAAINQNCMKEFTNMPQALKNLVAPRGNAHQPAPVATPAPVQAPVTPLQPATAGLDENAIFAHFQAAEASRRSEITDLFALAGNRFPDLLAQCHADMATTPAMAKAKIMEAMGKDTQPAGVNAAHIRAGNGNIVGDSVKASVLARAGLAERQADNAYNFMTLAELARASLVDRGIGISGLGRMEIVGQAFTHTTSDFGYIMLDVANKAVLKGWDESEETFQKWTKRGELNDFKIAHRVGMGEFGPLDKIREGAEYKYATLSDRGEQIALATYGKAFSITRQAIINDDLHFMLDIAKKLGAAAKATIGDLVYALLVANPALKTDNKAIFHADHKNLLTGATSALSVDSLDAGRTKMRTQKTDGGNRTLNIRPAYVLTPVCLESKANQLIRSASVPGADSNSGIDNPIRNFAEVIGEPRLDDASTTAWYLAAGQGSDTIEVAYLNGIDTPYIEQQQGFEVDGIKTKVRIDAGVAPLDYRGLIKANGA